MAEVTFCGAGGVTRLRALREIWPCRILFPLTPRGGRPQAVAVNTAGGMVAGDRIDQRFAAQHGAGVTFTTQAAEKIYRSDGKACRMRTEIHASVGCQVEWIPQETILFEGCRLRRRTRLVVDPGSVVLAGEITVFGRRARGERFAAGSLHDSWEVRRGGELAWADRMRIEVGLDGGLRRPFAFGSAAAAALLVCHSPHPLAVRDCGRTLLGANPAGGFTLVNGLTIGRFVSEDAGKLRELFVELWVGLRRAAGMGGADIPRLWHL